MATVNRFEDLVAFQKSRELVSEVYKSLRHCDDRGFKDQIQRASVSILSNIAEGFESGKAVVNTREWYEGRFYKLSLYRQSICGRGASTTLCGA